MFQTFYKKFGTYPINFFLQIRTLQTLEYVGME